MRGSVWSVLGFQGSHSEVHKKQRVFELAEDGCNLLGSTWSVSVECGCVQALRWVAQSIDKLWLIPPEANNLTSGQQRAMGNAQTLRLLISRWFNRLGLAISN